MQVERLKTVLLFILTGAGIAEVVASFFAPKFIAWYNTPGDGVGDALCNPAVIIGTTIRSFVEWQLIGAAVGAMVGLILGIIIVRAGIKKQPSGSTGTPPSGVT